MSHSPITIDYALAMDAAVGDGGLSEASLDGAAPAFESALKNVMARVDSGELGFWKLPGDRSGLPEIKRLAARLSGARDVLLLGIGGSSLGARAIVHALTTPLTAAGFEPEGPRLHLPDNSDPWLLAALLGRLDPAQTVAVVVSKSGGTVETAAQLLCVREWLVGGVGQDALGKHLIAVTDPESGTLRALATELKLETLPIAANIGGRFCAFTAAGLLPACAAGIDPAELLDGAAAMASRCESTDLRSNPAGLLAALSTLHTREKGHHIHVMMPYADALRPFANWFVQLWAESLGKRVDRSGNVIEVGPTPLPAIGATDQHAQVQLFVEGPRDKLVTFVAVDRVANDLTLPKQAGELAYLGGHSLAELLDAERRGTALALARDGRPSLCIHLPELSPHHLGGLLFLYEAATAIAGELLDINAFDQPGVEAGKHLAFGLLGRAGFEANRAEVEQSEATRNPSHRV